MDKLTKFSRLLPKGAIIGVAFALTSYLFGKGIIGQAELDLISQIAMAIGITGSMVTRYNSK